MSLHSLRRDVARLRSRLPLVRDVCCCDKLILLNGPEETPPVRCPDCGLPFPTDQVVFIEVVVHTREEAAEFMQRNKVG